MSTKKKRKPLKRRKPSTLPRFAVEDRVRVKYGVPDPDFPDIPLGGWAGTITEVSHDAKSHLYLIKCKVSVVGLANLDCYCPEEVGLLFRIRHEGEQAQVVQTRVRGRSSLFGFMSHVLGMSAPISHEDADFMPLSDLELTDKGANQQLLKDFHYWLRNHC